jgi:stage V sporulation protein G
MANNKTEKTEKTESVKMVSNVQIFPFKTGCTGGTDKVAALANITLFGKFLVRGLRVKDGQNGLYVQYPQQDATGMSFSSVVTPLDREARETVEAEVIEAYQRAGV